MNSSLGILSILPSTLPPPPPPSLRRTLSADMSSSNWLYNNHINTNSHSLSSILSDAPRPAAVPYEHPLFEKSTHFLNQNSLLICTETLGSDSGSDNFSSESIDFDTHILKAESPQTETIQSKPIKSRRNKTPPRSFPPPISSLNSPDGGSLCVQSRRENGRLILDAVSVPSRKKFQSDRRDGRLILSYFTTTTSTTTTTPVNSNVEDEEIDLEKAPRLSSSVLNFHRLAMMMKKPNGLMNRNPAWPKDKESSLSLPPRPPVTAAPPSLNAYEYYWRSKPAGIHQQHNQPIKNITGKLMYSNKNSQMANDKQQILVLRGNRGDYLVPISNGCKVPRRSLLLREPCCIATT